MSAYVHAALALQGFALTPAEEEAVAEQFARIEAIAAVFLVDVLPDDLESGALLIPAETSA
ncbi:MAG: AtzG-like protein [Janthinobacterium lividum]